jgi:hypothetical protein
MQIFHDKDNKVLLKYFSMVIECANSIRCKYFSFGL